MARDRSLEEFTGGNEDERDDAGETPTERGPVDPDGGPPGPDSGEPSEDGEIDPIATTYRWSSDGGACGACGTRVEARWRDGDAFVCAACKEW